MIPKPIVGLDQQDLDGAAGRARQQGLTKFRFRVEGMSAYMRVRSADQFVGLIRELRKNRDFHRAVVEVEKLQRELKLRRGVGLPVPEEVRQMPHPSLVICWGQLSIIAFEGGIGSLIGGAGGQVTRGITSELLDALALRVRMQTLSQE